MIHELDLYTPYVHLIHSLSFLRNISINKSVTKLGRPPASVVTVSACLIFQVRLRVAGLEGSTGKGRMPVAALGGRFLGNPAFSDSDFLSFKSSWE